MLSIESETRLADCFLRAAEGERQVEFFRGVLSQTPYTDLRSLFERLDRCSNGYVGCTEIQDQVCLAGGVCSETEAVLILRQYDGDADGRWSFSEFSNLVLPATSPTLRSNLLASEYGPLSPESESVFYKLLLAELQYQRDVDSARSALAVRYDFNLLDAFRTVDTSDSSALGPENLASFMQRRGVGMTADMAACLIRRVDMDGDSRISYVEFVDFLLPMKNPRAGLRLSASSSMRVSTPRSNSASLKKRRPATPSKPFSPLNQSQPRYSTPLKSPNNAKSKPSEYSLATKSQGEPSLDDLGTAIKSDLELFRELQWAKNELLQSSDFSPIVAFRVFDRWGHGEITQGEFTAGMYALGVTVLEEDVKGLFAGVGTGRRLSYNDFVTLLSPGTQRVTERTGVHSNLSQQTLKRLSRVCQTHLTLSRVPEAIRRAFASVENPERILDEVIERLCLRPNPSERSWLLSRYIPVSPRGLSASQLQ